MGSLTFEAVIMAETEGNYSPGLRTCSGCGERKARIEYAPNKLGRDGLTAKCKKCEAIRRVAKRMANPGKIKSRELHYRINNAQKIKLSHVASDKKNAAKIKARKADWYKQLKAKRVQDAQRQEVLF